MKSVILIFSLFSLTYPVWAQELVKIKDGTKLASISVIKNNYELKGFDYSDRIPKNKCSEKIIQNLLTRLDIELKKTLPFKESSAIKVQVKKNKKMISPQSKLGRKLANFATTIVILKKEVGLSCKL